MVLTVDLTSVPKPVRDQMHSILTRSNEREMIAARIRQEQIAKFFRNNQPRAKDGFGGMEMAIDPYWVSYWRAKLKNPRIWNDPDFTDWLRRHEEAIRVRSTGTRIQIGVDGFGAGTKFKKVYQ